MGRGDNRKTLKMRRRKAHNQKKERLARRIEEAKGSGASKPKSAKSSGASTTRRRGKADA